MSHLVLLRKTICRFESITFVLFNSTINFIKRVIEYLRDTGKTSTIALWGRSMGAATALLHGERDPSIAGQILIVIHLETH
jgi:dienelactone hydrolase